MQALAQYAPNALRAITGTSTGVATDTAAAESAVAPIYNALYNQGQLAGAGTEAAVAEGPGQRLVTAADKYQQQVDPEAYKSRALVSQALEKYLSGYDPNKLTGGEEAQIARGVGATGGSFTPSNMNTVRNAMTFGSAGTERWKNFGDAVGKAAATLPNLKSGINAFNVATQRGSAQTGQGAQATNTATGFAQSALGDMGAAQRTAMQKKKDTMDMVIGGTQAFSNVMQGIGSVMPG